ncbi:MAG: hypothetical protein JRI23_18050 [Deltaproteobacteria bacterium]|nr:hypothetical protein [Deltaproteobacteria bacterium]MBW2533749.1 hypothetical protein [Deltaproteobacteria bacterium]
MLCWGRDEEKQLGAEPQSPRRGPPGARPPLSQLVPRNDQPRLVEAVSQVVQIASGANHSCARTAAGRVWCWGDNRRGQLGTGRASEPVRKPQRVAGLAGVADLAAGGDQACVALADRTVSCWGASPGTKEIPPHVLPSPTAIAGVRGIVRVAVGASRACAMTEDDQLSCWTGGPVAGGWHELGQPPASVPGVERARAVVLGLTASCATRPSGAVVCWGRNPYGMVSSEPTSLLGEPTPYDGTTAAEPLPARSTAPRDGGSTADGG